MSDLIERIDIHGHCGEDCIACELLKEARDEIERLNNVCEYARNEIKDQRKEIEQLTKMVTDLESLNGIQLQYLNRKNAEIEQLRAALEEIAEMYTPNWKAGDTRATTQRLSTTAKEALSTQGVSRPDVLVPHPDDVVIPTQEVDDE